MCFVDQLFDFNRSTNSGMSMRPTKSRSAIHNHFIGRPLVAVSFARISSVVYCVTRHITKITGLQESNSHNFTRKNSLTLSWIITSFEFSKNTEETWVFKTGNYRKRGSTICNVLLFDFQFTQLKWSRMTHEHSLIPSGRSASPLSSTVWPERERPRRYYSFLVTIHNGYSEIKFLW